MIPSKTPYTRTTTKSRRLANPPRFVHVSKWFEADKDGDPVECHKTFKLDAAQRQAKLIRRKWYRKSLAKRLS